MMRRWIGFAVLPFLLVSLGYLLRGQLTGGVRLGGAPSRLESRWQTEEQWLVESIARDLAEMSRFAAEGRAPSADIEVTVMTPAPGGLPLTVAVSLGSGRRVTQELAVGTYVWAPEEYAGLARALLDAGGVRGPRDEGRAEWDLLATLTDLRAEVIERANQRVSSALASRFTDPTSHEAAALVLAAFAWREAAGMYSDTRATLCRIAAHLAFAAALRGQAAGTAEGRCAHAILLIVAGRGADAAAALDALAPDRRPSVQVWRRALQRRLLEDTRMDPEPGSFLERRELYRALLTTVDSDAALRYLERLGGEKVTDWWRLAATPGFTVETGNVLLADAVEREIEEARGVWRIGGGAPLSDEELAKALNRPAERCIGPDGPRVVGWGTWAAFFQRHLISTVWCRDYHLRQMLGLYREGDEADQKLREANRLFGSLTLYPLVEARCEAAARRRPKRFDELITLTVEQPQLINAFQWWAMQEAARYEVIRRGVPELAAWFKPGVPRGTTYDTVGRRDASLLPRDLAGLQAFQAISPQDFEVTATLARAQFQGQGPVEAVERLFGPRVQYDMRALNHLTRLAVKDAAALSSLLERTCAISAVHCFDYADALVEAGEPDRAARAYQRAIDLSADRVGAANSSLWLVHYYLDKGEPGRAQALAMQAAETGSARGLTALSRFLERTGDYQGAEELLHQVLARYGNPPQTPEEQEESKDGSQQYTDRLAALYYRMWHDRKRAAYAERFRELTKDAFPQGLEPADLTAFSGYPADGVFVLKTWPNAERAGLRVGDIIVALDGYRVRTRRQYFLIRQLSDAPEMSLVVFRHPRYLELRPRVAWRALGVEARSHKPAGH